MSRGRILNGWQSLTILKMSAYSVLPPWDVLDIAPEPAHYIAMHPKDARQEACVAAARRYSLTLLKYTVTFIS